VRSFCKQVRYNVEHHVLARMIQIEDLWGVLWKSFCIVCGGGRSFLTIRVAPDEQVVQYRMQSEYGVETQLEPLSFSVARWVTGGWPALEKVGRIYNCATVKDQVREFLARNFNMLVEEVNTLGSICWHHASILHLTVVYHMEFEQVVLIPSQSNHKFES
jgi:hypothetical protein